MAKALTVARFRAATVFVCPSLCAKGDGSLRTSPTAVVSGKEENRAGPGPTINILCLWSASAGIQPSSRLYSWRKRLPFPWH